MSNHDVTVCYLHPADHIAASFHHSLMNCVMRDLTGLRRLRKAVPSVASTMGLPAARNTATRAALDSGAEWVWWVDSDMGFDPDTLDRLLAVADPTGRPIVGGLCFGQAYDTVVGGRAPDLSMFPTLYDFNPSTATFQRWSDYPRDSVVRVGATGAAMLLVHRTVFDTIAADEGDAWFTPVPHPDGAASRHALFGEDVSFCLRAVAAGFPIHVDTGIRTSHLKPRWLTEELFDDEQATIPNFAVIPTVGTGGYVKDLLLEIEAQGQCDHVFVLDNGCPKHVVNWLDTHNPKWITRVEMFDAGIHDMWNAGLEAARQARLRCNIAVLNDDLRIGPDFLAGLAAGLRARWDVGVVGPNYDGRAGTGVQPVNGICAGRYDGTGGLPGFAFMLRGEDGYLFPPGLRWWYGDNDMVLTYRQRGRVAGIVLDVTCEHIDGGSKTGRWDDPEYAAMIAADRTAFLAKWAKPGGDDA